MQMTAKDILTQIHMIYEGDVDVPTSSSDEDYQMRLGLMNLAIAEWEAAPGVLWRPLVMLSIETVPETGTQIELPADFAKMYDGVVKIGSEKITEVPLERVAAYQLEDEDGEQKYFYVTGSPSTGYKIQLAGVSVSEGDEISYSYIRHATQITKSEDVPDVPDPTYIIHRVVAELYAQDSDPKSGRELSISQSLLDQMILANSLTSIQADNTYET